MSVTLVKLPHTKKRVNMGCVRAHALEIANCRYARMFSVLLETPYYFKKYIQVMVRYMVYNPLKRSLETQQQ